VRYSNTRMEFPSNYSFSAQTLREYTFERSEFACWNWALVCTYVCARWIKTRSIKLLKKTPALFLSLAVAHSCSKMQSMRCGNGTQYILLPTHLYACEFALPPLELIFIIKMLAGRRKERRFYFSPVPPFFTRH
jgi:hypothetical protein